MAIKPSYRTKVLCCNSYKHMDLRFDQNVNDQRDSISTLRAS
jgi:hypothetical protein